MEIDAEMRRKIVVSVAAVAVFIVLLVAVGATYTTDHNLSRLGAYYLVAIIGLFVVLMGAVGLLLDRW